MREQIAEDLKKRRGNTPVARERFFFGERGGQFYGIVRWDSSEYDTARNRWIIKDRTVGLKRGDDCRVTCDGMRDRGSKD